jgi:hypothetical protein
MNMRKAYGVFLVGFLLVLSTPSNAQAPLGTGFTYQGEIQEGGDPVDGTVHLRFSLWNAATEGNQIGVDQLISDVSVAEGVFTVILNASGEFGPTAFNGESRWLQIEVCADPGCASLSVLSPRQPITGTPYALSAPWSGLSGVPEGFADGVDDIGEEPWETSGTDIFRATGNVGVGTANPVAKLDVRGGAMLVENIGDQADLLWLASERSWVFRQEGTGAGTALKLQSIGGGGNKYFIIQTDGAVGIGASTPTAKLDVRGDIALGPSGQFRAAAGEENLRIIRGVVDANGGIIVGSGFTVSHPSLGKYTITFDTPFAGLPSITATVQRQKFVTAFSDGVFKTHANLELLFPVTHNSATKDDSAFHFIAIGPR